MERLISGVVLAGLAVAAMVWLPPLALRVLVCAVALLASREYAVVAGIDGAIGRGALSAATVVLCWLMSGDTSPRVDLLLVAALGWVATAVLWGNHSIQITGTAVVGAAYIGLPLGLLAALRIWAGWPATLLMLATVVVSDSAQYYTGRALGRHPLAPSISPKKTIEGAVGGLVAGPLVMVALGRVALPMTGRLELVLLGLVVVGLGICGDLFESRLKRVAGVKDSSALIPGHGGVLDRIDALLFVTPVFYLFLRLSAAATV